MENDDMMIGKSFKCFTDYIYNNFTYFRKGQLVSIYEIEEFVGEPDQDKIYFQDPEEDSMFMFRNEIFLYFLPIFKYGK